MKRIKYLVCSLLLTVAAFAAGPDGTIVNKTEKVSADEPAGELHLGRYELYSGIPSIYLGHFILLPNGRYKVAFDNDETNYDESGRYKWHKETNTIEWISGMFKNNNWGGKLSQTAKGYHIQFNKATYGDSGK